jgi:hypothetical protein
VIPVKGETMTETTPAKTTPATRKRAPRKLAAVPAPADVPATPAPATAPEAAPAAVAAPAPVAAPVEKLPLHRRHAKDAAPSAMVYFTEWILENCPEFAPLAEIDRGLLERLVTVASKDYRAFQSDK